MASVRITSGSIAFAINGCNPESSRGSVKSEPVISATANRLVKESSSCELMQDPDTVSIAVDQEQPSSFCFAVATKAARTMTLNAQKDSGQIGNGGGDENT